VTAAQVLYLVMLAQNHFSLIKDNVCQVALEQHSHQAEHVKVLEILDCPPLRFSSRLSE